MNTKAESSGLAHDFIRIHKAITRGLTVSITRGSEFISNGFPDPGLQKGFVVFLQTLIASISAHHLGEDEVAFPALKQRLSDVPFGRLEADHLLIQSKLEWIKSALPELHGSESAAALVNVIDSLKEILAVWTPHIEAEELAFSAAAFAEVMTPDEQARLAADVSKYSQEHGGPPFYALPFVLFNLPPADRADMSRKIPQTVLEELIPGEWKDQWAPMKPFLLD